MAKAKTKDKDKDKDKPAGPRPRNDAYVMMLFLTFVALVAGTVMMYLDHEEYGGKQPPKEAIPGLPKLGDSIKTAEPPAEPKGGEPKGGDPMGGEPKGGEPMGGEPKMTP